MLKLVSAEAATDTCLWVAILLDAALITMAIIVAWLFFTRRRVAVTAFIALLIARIVVSIIQLPLTENALGVDAEDFTDVVQSIVYSAVWIPYFLKSKRVRNTFVK